MQSLLIGAALLAAASAVPSFDIDLDLPAEQRFSNVTKFYRTDALAMLKGYNQTLHEKFSQEELEEWSQVLKKELLNYPGYLAELEGIVNDLDDPVATLDMVLFYNALYEMESPTMCSGLLMADEDGQVIHARNLDYKFLFELPDGTVHDWPDVTFDQVFWQGGKELMTTVGWPMYTSVHTGMRFNGWTFEQNTRLIKNDHTANLGEAKRGGVTFGWKIRHLLETEPSFESALQQIESTDFMAPQYFILSGAGPFEGAVFSVDRGGKALPGTPPVQRIDNQAGEWHLLQTNDDVSSVPLDPRRPLTNKRLAQQAQSDVSLSLAWKLVRSPTLFNPVTAFTWVASPQTGYYHTIVHSESPPEEFADMVAEVVGEEEVQLMQNQPQKARIMPRSKWAHRATSQALS